MNRDRKILDFVTWLFNFIGMIGSIYFIGGAIAWAIDNRDSQIFTLYMDIRLYFVYGDGYADLYSFFLLVFALPILIRSLWLVYRPQKTFSKPRFFMVLLGVFAAYWLTSLQTADNEPQQLISFGFALVVSLAFLLFYFLAISVLRVFFKVEYRSRISLLNFSYVVCLFSVTVISSLSSVSFVDYLVRLVLMIQLLVMLLIGVVSPSKPLIILFLAAFLAGAA